jgi:hypothetical protein
MNERAAIHLAPVMLPQEHDRIGPITDMAQPTRLTHLRRGVRKKLCQHGPAAAAAAASFNASIATGSWPLYG